MKKCSFLILFLALIIRLSATAMAHAGDTDSNGGHYDSATGKYHYHHGYPAHMHYDMDGDGYRDCPYNFDDMTGADSGSSGGSGGSNNYTPLSYSDGYADGHKDGYDDGYDDGRDAGYDSGYNEGRKKGQSEGYDDGYSQGKESLVGWIFLLTLALAVICIAFYKTSKKKSEEISALKRGCTSLEAINAEIVSKKQECDQVKAMLSLEQISLYNLRQETAKATQEYDAVNANLATEKAALSNVQKYRHRLKGAPSDVTFSDTGEPIYWKPDRNKPFGDYTVYINRSGKIYHTDRFCASCSVSIGHIFNVINHARPCERCAKFAFDFNAPPDWYTQASLCDTVPTVIKVAYLVEKAVEWGVDFDIAKRLINYERADQGLPPAQFEEDCYFPERM